MNKKLQDPLEVRRKELEAQIARHKKTLENIEKINEETKQIELLEREEKQARFLLEHPKVASAGRKLKRLLGSTSDKIDKAVAEYKKFNKKHPPKKITFA